MTSWRKSAARWLSRAGGTRPRSAQRTARSNRPRRVSRPPGRFTETVLMRMSLTGCAGRSSLVARHTRSTDRVTRSRGCPKTPCALIVWPRQEITDVAAVDLLPDLLVAQGEQVGLDDRQQRVVRDARREPLRRPDHGAHADAAAQKLLQDAAAGAPGAAQEQNRHDLHLRILEHVIERDVEHPRDLKGHLERRRVAALLDGDDRLPGDAHPVGEIRLRHLAGGEPERPDAVGDPGRLAHRQKPLW